MLSILLFAALSAPGYGMTPGAVSLRSISKLTFSPDGILFAGDSIGAQVMAIDLDDRNPRSNLKKLDILDVEGKIATLLSWDSSDVLIHDMAVNPISKNAYFAVSRGRKRFVQSWQLPNDVADADVLIRLTPEGVFERVLLDNVKHSSAALANPVNETAKFDWKESRQRVDAISDMAFADGKLYVAGLSNEEFSSAMRVYRFPFDGSSSSTSIEIYHGSHGKYETDAPIRAFLPVRLQGKPYLMASYLCTPLVLIPTGDLKDKTHVKGSTIAELGDGNYPLSMLTVREKDKDYFVIVNSGRGVLSISADDLAKPAKPITSQIEGGTAGVAFTHLRNQGVLRAGNYGESNLLLMMRNPISGAIQLRTFKLEDMR